MGKPVFFRFKSRFGLLYPPFGFKQLNLGVEEGAAAIINADFLRNYPDSAVIDYEYPTPEAINPKDYFNLIAKSSREAISKVTDVLAREKSDIPVFVGGDHSIAFASVAAISQIHEPSETLLVSIDSHCDIHQPETSPSGNFHGMWLRPSLNKFSVAQIESLMGNKLLADNFCYIGNLDSEPVETDFIRRNGISTYTHTQTNAQPEVLIGILQSRLQDKRHLHVTLDIDAIQKEFAPGTGMPCEEGLLPGTVKVILKKLAQFPSRSLDIVEVNPRKDVAGKTVKLAQELIAEFV